MDLTNEETMAAVGAVLVVIGHVAAIIGKPEFVKGAKVLSLVWDVMAANYGKAKNKSE